MDFDISLIHALYLTELQGNNPGLEILLEDQGKINTPSPRIEYVSLTENKSPVQGILKKVTDTGTARDTEYTSHTYETFRYSIITNTKRVPGSDYKTVLDALKNQMYFFLISDFFRDKMENIGYRFIFDGQIQDGSIKKLPFFEYRKFFNITYGYIETSEQVHGSFIETININDIEYPN